MDNTNSTELYPSKSQVARYWLWLLPLAGLCGLAMCVGLGGTLLWLRSAGPEPPVKVEQSSGPNLTKEEVAAITTPVPSATPADNVVITLTPALEVEATPPSACVASQPAPLPSLTEPILSPISFATRPGSAGWPLDSSLQFTATLTNVLATFSYIGMSNGLPWERVWYFGEQELSRGQGVWDAGPQGKLTVQAALGQGAFAPGVYKLEIKVQNKLLSQGTFTVVAADTPITRTIQVAYTTWDGSKSSLHVLDIVSGQTEPLVEFARSPAWSADANGLLFYGEDGIAAGTPGLWVLNVGQRKTYQINQETSFGDLAWSPQRTFLASTEVDGLEPRLSLWDLNQNKAVADLAGADPAWSPEGQRLAYRRCDASGWHISVIPVIGSVFDTGRLQNLTNGDDSQPAWSWDGQRLAFVRREGDNQDIYLVNTDGSNLTRLTDQPAADVAPAWTPDGRLVFRSLREGQWGIYLMNADGAEQRQLLTTLTRAEWQPDRLAVSTNVKVLEPIPPKPQVQIPAGHGLLAISNQKNNDEMTFTIDNKEHKIGPYQVKMLPLRPGHYTWTASWPGKNSRTGSADIALGQIAAPIVER